MYGDVEFYGKVSITLTKTEGRFSSAYLNPGRYGCLARERYDAMGREGNDITVLSY